MEQALALHLDEAGLIVPPSDDPLEVRDWITALTKYIQSLPGEVQIDMPVKHTFLQGMYMRELFIPKGTVLVGKIHKMECMNIVSKGDISVITETGSARVKAGYSVVTPAGMQKVGVAHEDTIFVNVFRTDETNPDTIEDALAWSSYEQMALERTEAPCLSQ